MNLRKRLDLREGLGVTISILAFDGKKLARN